MSDRTFVLRLANAEYVFKYDPKDKQVLTCNSRLRAQQFTLQESKNFQSLYVCEIIPASWEREA